MFYNSYPGCSRLYDLKEGKTAMKQFKTLFFVALTTVALAMRLNAQQTNVGNITGSVEDTTGAIIPAAEVVALNPATGVTQSTVTTSQGVYFINLLQIGRYTVTVAKPGFQKETRVGINVIAGETSTVNFALRVGATSQTITVSASPSIVNTTDTNQGTTRTLQEIQDLPINLMGNAARAAVNTVQSLAGVNFTLGVGQSWMVISRAEINGVQASFGYEIDGTEASTGEGENGEDFVSPTPAQISEVRLTNNTDTTKGFNAGVTIALVSKSGTNKLHGSR